MGILGNGFREVTFGRHDGLGFGNDHTPVFLLLLEEHMVNLRDFFFASFEGIEEPGGSELDSIDTPMAGWMDVFWPWVHT
jgi:hypothetical protein